MPEFKQLPINADRICEAISKIGYNPCSAILDIIDNSVVARATTIDVLLFIKESSTINNTQNIEKIQVVDSGCGMYDSEIENALQLGSNVTYEKNSLSKYGLGLKSAGFSLGTIIEVVSKKDNIISKLQYLDREMIRDKKVFGISIEEAPQDYINLLDIPIPRSSGTVVTIKKIIYTSRVSAGKVMDELCNRAGVHYFSILEKGNININIKIIKQLINGNLSVEKERKIHPKDILFWKESKNIFEKESYDCKLPCKVLDSEIENPLNPSGAKIKIKATIFPMDSMKNYPLFTEAERAVIDKYEIGNKNSGFYFYRNDRLIRWGEKQNLNKEFGFRAKIDFSTEHDDLFGVDVSKQQLTIPEDLEKSILALCQVPREQSRELFEICQQLLKDYLYRKKEGAEFNLRNSTLEEDEEETTGTDQKESNDRKQKLSDESDENFKSDEPKYEDVIKEEGFKRVRYWDKSKTSALWESAIDRIEGTYVLINKNHPFYNQTLSRLSNGSPSRQAIEALIHSLAVGQNQTIEKFHDVDYEMVKYAFEKFIRSASHQIDNWVSNNWDLFENDN